MSTLKKIVITSVKLGSGVSSKSGKPKPYKFANVSFLKEAKDFVNDDHNIQMAGYEIQEVSMAFDVGLFSKFQTNCPFLQPVNLLLSADPENPARNIVTGFEVLDEHGKVSKREEF